MELGRMKNVVRKEILKIGKVETAKRSALQANSVNCAGVC